MTDPADPRTLSPGGTAAEGHDTDDAGRSSRRGIWLVLAGIAALLVPATLIAVALLGEEDSGPTKMVVEIPAGTGDRIAAGEAVEILPPLVELRVGDQIELRNLDDQVHTVGPLTARPGETLLQVFGQAGRFEGDCTLLPSKKVVISVT